MSGRVTLQVLGCGDAFGSGGRYHTCFFVRSEPAKFLIDCGASSLIAMKRFGVDPAAVETILLTHLHGDHFAGLPFLIIEANFGKRTRPLTIAGPGGTKRRLVDAMEVLFPGSSRVTLPYPLEVIELTAAQPHALGGITVTPYAVEHPTTGAAPLALRIACDGRLIAYSGDTVWTESLRAVARDADLFIVEAYTYDQKTRLHMDYVTLAAHLPELGAKRVLLTHMGADMLARAGSLPFEAAEDGQIVHL